jgi:sporulation-control protein spo0M
MTPQEQEVADKLIESIRAVANDKALAHVNKLDFPGNEVVVIIAGGDIAQSLKLTISKLCTKQEAT